MSIGDRTFRVLDGAVLEPTSTSELVVRSLEFPRCTAHGRVIVEIVRWGKATFPSRLFPEPWVWHADDSGFPADPCR